MSAVVLVHGIWMPGTEMGLLRWRLRRRGWYAVQFAYPSVTRSVADNVLGLQRFLEKLKNDEVHFLGHSLGGLLILRLFAEFPGQRPGRIVALGSPFRGSWVARRLAEQPIGRGLLGHAAHILQEGYVELPSGRDIGVIAGTRPIGMGRLLPGMPGPSDGTVLVQETRLAEIRHHRTLPVSHTTLLLSHAVADQAHVFLRYGRFSEIAWETSLRFL